MQINRMMPVRFGTSLHPLTPKIARLNEILEQNGIDTQKLTYQTVGADELILDTKTKLPTGTKLERADLLKAMSDIARKPGSGLNQMQDASNLFGLDGEGGILIQVGPDENQCVDWCGTKYPGQK